MGPFYNETVLNWVCLEFSLFLFRPFSKWTMFSIGFVSHWTCFELDQFQIGPFGMGLFWVGPVSNKAYFEVASFELGLFPIRPDSNWICLGLTHRSGRWGKPWVIRRPYIFRDKQLDLYIRFQSTLMVHCNFRHNHNVIYRHNLIYRTI